MAKSTGHVIGLTEAVEPVRPDGRASVLPSSPLSLASRVLAESARGRRGLLRASDGVRAQGGHEVARATRLGDDGTVHVPPWTTTSTPPLRSRCSSTRFVRRTGLSITVDDAGGLAAAVIEILEVLGLVSIRWPRSRRPRRCHTGAVQWCARDRSGCALSRDCFDRREPWRRSIEARQAARQAKDWALSDAIRDGLADIGIVIEDTADGVRWHRK